MTQQKTTITDDTVLAFTPVASFQSLGEGAVILLADSGQLYTCNETTESFLNHIDGNRTLRDIVECALLEYEVDRERLNEDFRTIAGELVSEGILQKA